MQENKEDKLSHWRLKDYLTIDQAAALWIEEEPPLIWDPDSFESYFENKPAFEVVRIAICEALVRGEFKARRFVVDNIDPGGTEWPHTSQTTIKREALAEWAFRRGERPPFFSKDIEKLEQLGKELEDVAPFLNSSHPHFPEELEIAVRAWMALYEKGEERGRKSHKDYIRNWLKKNYPDLTNNAAERIATVVNPDKKGGAPSQ